MMALLVILPVAAQNNRSDWSKPFPGLYTVSTDPLR